MCVKGVVTNIQRYSLNDGDGIRTVVFLKGCPLRCAWCANPETQTVQPQILLNEKTCMDCGYCASACPQSMQKGQGGKLCIMCMSCVDGCPKGALELVGKSMSVNDVLEEVEKDRLFYGNSGGGLTVSGGEPLMQPDFTKALLQEAKQRGLHCAIETSGHGSSEAALEIFELCDQILFDCKHTDPEEHLRHTGVDNRLILKNLALAAEKFASRITLRIPFIDGVNATEENVEATIALAKKLGIEEIHLLPYHELGKGKYEKLGRPYEFEGTTPTTEQLTYFEQKILSSGLRCKLRG